MYIDGAVSPIHYQPTLTKVREAEKEKKYSRVQSDGMALRYKVTFF